MRILSCQGIGDLIWALCKIQDLSKLYGDGIVDIRIACFYRNRTETRALDFVKRFKFVNSAEMYVIPRVGSVGPTLLPGKPADKNGIYRYIQTGPIMQYPGIDYVMVANGHLELGQRLENWLPDVKTNWNVMDRFIFKDNEKIEADNILDKVGPFVVFFMGNYNGNTTVGHNRNAIWSPAEWVELGDEIHKKYGYNIIIVGSSFDKLYYNLCIRDQIKYKKHWHSYIGKWDIGTTYAVIDKSKFVVSFQSGIGIVAHYMDKPVAIFWRQKGDSIDPDHYISFSENMSHCWSKPGAIQQGKFMPCIYGKHKVEHIIDYIDRNSWNV